MTIPMTTNDSTVFPLEPEEPIIILSPTVDRPLESDDIDRRYPVRERFPSMKARGLLANAEPLYVDTPITYEQAITRSDADKWKSAMLKEIHSIVKNKTWTLVPASKDKSVVSTKWVYKIKDDGSYKARFVARGFTQQFREDYDETYAPTAKYQSLRALIALKKNIRLRKLHQMDVDTAYLYGLLKELVYLRQPKGYEVAGKEDWVYQLNKVLYGLKQSARA